MNAVACAVRCIVETLTSGDGKSTKWKIFKTFGINLGLEAKGSKSGAKVSIDLLNRDMTFKGSWLVGDAAGEAAAEASFSCSLW